MLPQSFLSMSSIAARLDSNFFILTFNFLIVFEMINYYKNDIILLYTNHKKNEKLLIPHFFNYELDKSKFITAK